MILTNSVFMDAFIFDVLVLVLDFDRLSFRRFFDCGDSHRALKEQLQSMYRFIVGQSSGGSSSAVV